jgi:hypothetical protein
VAERGRERLVARDRGIEKTRVGANEVDQRQGAGLDGE